MRFFTVCAAFAVVFGGLTMQASVLPMAHLESATLAAFQSYTARFEQQVSSAFSSSGKLWIDDDHSSRHRDFDAGKPVVEARENQDVANGSIHHYSGTIRVPGARIEQINRVMSDYPNYPNYFKPDIAKGSGVLQADSTPEESHFRTRLFITESTLWLDVAYDAQYDSHYRKLDDTRWVARSTTLSIKELLDAKKLDGGAYPEGQDHGFLWRSNTYWFARERDGGLDLQVDSMTLSRPTPVGFGWWGNKRTHDAVDKMLRDTKAAIESVRGS